MSTASLGREEKEIPVCLMKSSTSRKEIKRREYLYALFVRLKEEKLGERCKLLVYQSEKE